MKNVGIGSMIVFAAAVVACGSSAEAPTTLQVTGAVDARLLALDNASAIATAADGSTYSAYLRANGTFTLDLPLDKIYRVAVVNTTATGDLRAIGHLVNPTANGPSDVIAVREGGELHLGVLRPVGSVPAAGAVATRSGGSGGDDSDHVDDGRHDESDDRDDRDGDDYKCHRKDDDKDRVCVAGSSDDVELEADNPPRDKCATKRDDDRPKSPSKSCQSPADGSAGGGAPPVPVPTGGTCLTNIVCSGGDICVASKCTAPTGTVDPGNTAPAPPAPSLPR